ncbi:efflux RND transporter permease subunit [Dokdonella sp.]|uniref:efflux RND transporter permease subunit n=1 Tax=Dokdonella sp. TaxID=2291710 RepID=UPI003C335492
MGFSTLFIRRPIATSLLMAGVLLLGVMGYRLLPVSALPDIDAPSIQVTTQYPGASPSTMAALVTTPLERQFGQISGLGTMTSDSSAGLSTILLTFNMDRDIDAAAQDVQSAINAGRGTLPNNLPYPPVYNKVNPADAPILTLVMSSDALPLREVNNFADSILSQKLSQVSGVGLVSIAGNVRPAVRIQVDPAAIANQGLTIEDVRSVLTQANVNGPKGTVNGASQSFTIGANDQLTDADGYRNTIISYKGGAPVRLGDVAKVIDGVENDQLAAWANGKPAVLLDIRRQPGANIVQTVDNIKLLLPELRALLPANVHLDVFADRTVTIRASVEDVEFTLMLTIGLVIAVIFVFLRRLWATVIPSIAVPLSIMGTFAVMSTAAFSLDNLSLMALTVATGFVVDDAIVMIENIVRYIEKGRDPKEAAEVGAKEIGFTVLSLTVSLIAVFLPLLLMPGVTGRLFKEFAIVLSIAVGISMIVSLTLTPMMCAYLLRRENVPHEDNEESPGRSGSRDWWDRLVAAYARSLDWVFGHQKLTMLVLTATVALTVLLFVTMPKGLLPEQDTGMITGVVQADETIAFEAMLERTQRVAEALRADPAVDGVAAFVGAGSINPTLNQGQLSIVLKPRSERGGLDELMPRLQGTIDRIPGVALFLKPVQDIALDNRVAPTEYQYALTEVDEEELGRFAERMTAALQQRPELADVDNNLAANGLQLNLTINRDQASRLGVPIQTIDDTLYSAFGQRQISTIFTQLNQYRVVLEVDPKFRTSGDLLNRLSVRGSGSSSVLSGSNATTLGQATSSNSATPSGIGSQGNTGIAIGAGGVIPMASLVDAKVINAPLVISHQDQLPAVTISFNVAAGYSLSDAVEAIADVEQSIGMPAQIRGKFIGKAAEFSASMTDEVLLILASLVVIYIVLGVLYESYIHPITIISTLPPAGVGALLALSLCGFSLSIDGIVGIILLIGIVKKNAIMMIDFAIEARRTGANAHDAIRRAALLRFRPILMTTFAAMFGALPLALGTGIGSELRQPLGVSIVGGLLLSQLITLYTTPVLYLQMERLSDWFSAWNERRTLVAERGMA